MSVALLYGAVILIWGSSWIMIKFQLGVVSPEVSVAYRFALASVVMFAWALTYGLPLRFSLRNHACIALQGMLICSMNFYLLYSAGYFLTTGLIAVIFSTASALTLIINAALERTWPKPNVAVGVMLGILGIAIIFWPELTAIAAPNVAAETAAGLTLALAGTLSFALGGIVTARNHAAGLSVRGSTAWAMLYGTLLLMVIAGLTGESFTFDFTFPYVASLIYLALIASVIGFACYFGLLSRIGTDRAAYVTVLFPIVALSLSTLFENYQWTELALLGVALTLLGNVLVLMPRARSFQIGSV